jgi:hypothetical protein
VVDDSTSIGLRSVYKISHSRVDALISYVFLFGVMCLMQFRYGPDSECASHFVQVSEKCDGDPGND